MGVVRRRLILGCVIVVELWSVRPPVGCRGRFVVGLSVIGSVLPVSLVGRRRLRGQSIVSVVVPLSPGWSSSVSRSVRRVGRRVSAFWLVVVDSCSVGSLLLVVGLHLLVERSLSLRGRSSDLTRH